MSSQDTRRTHTHIHLLLLRRHCAHRRPTITTTQTLTPYIHESNEKQRLIRPERQRHVCACVSELFAGTDERRRSASASTEAFREDVCCAVFLCISHCLRLQLHPPLWTVVCRRLAFKFNARVYAMLFIEYSIFIRQ